MRHPICLAIFGLLFCGYLFPSCQSEELVQKDYYQSIAEDSIINADRDYLIFLGDIQNYTDDDLRSEYLYSSIDWIRCQNNYYHNFKFIFQNGDVTNNNASAQWIRANNAIKHCKDSIPFLCCVGNHDYDLTGHNHMEINDRHSTHLTKYTINGALRKNIIESFEGERIENIIVTTGLPNIYLVSLEFGARTEVVDWAKNFISSHKTAKFIILTHEFIDKNGKIIGNEGFSTYQLKVPFNTPEYIWSELIAVEPNIICVACGHSGFHYVSEKINEFNLSIPIILFNLQYAENGGDSMIQIWEFDLSKNHVHTFVYNSLRRHIITGTTYDFYYK